MWNTNHIYILYLKGNDIMMTIEEFREQNPNSCGNLCWNCRYNCDHWDRRHNGARCISFERALSLSTSEQRAYLMKALREEYESSKNNAINYFYKAYRSLYFNDEETLV